MKRPLFLLFAAIILSQCKKPEYQKQDMLVTGTSQPVISLDGTWKFTMTPPENFFMNEVTASDWSMIKVPGECAMQGFAIKHNQPYVYKTFVKIPADYSGKVIKLRFESVYSYARVWVNGKFIRDHKGGFTPWECDITESVVPGTEAWITVEFTDMDDDLSYASGYAKHQIGGILRSVSLKALPANFPEAIYINTVFHEKYRNADLQIKVLRSKAGESWAGFRMYDRNGNQVRLSDRRFRLKNDTTFFSFSVNNPLEWNAENPNLYTLIVEVFDKSVLTASYKTRFGFREIKVEGNRLMINGRQVKLRGACRHDIHPLLGRVATAEYDKMDVLLAKEANMNFIRTSHYPPSESFLRYCDEYGIYVEDESAVCFVNTHRNRFYKDLKQFGPEFLHQQLAQVGEMVQNHINHPSVIIWSLGNESLYNEGFKMGYDYIKSSDNTRPVIFSYPGSVPDSVKCYDILSLHYPSWNGSLTQRGVSVKGFNYDRMPVIYDEWAHVPCYNKPELLEDMNVRNFWGQSLDSMWTNLFESGGTGGAIWGMIDETFSLPDTMSGYDKWWGIQEVSNGVKMYEGPVIGYGEWGIGDVWRRRKPEFWNTKKAYSPVKILTDEITEFKAGHSLKIPVHNRFSHTNLKDIRTVCRYRGRNVLEIMQNVEPSERGDIQLPPNDWEEGEILNIRFLTRESQLIDEYNLRFGKRNQTTISGKKGEINVKETTGGILEITTGELRFFFNKKSCMFENVRIEGDTVIKSGPWFHYRYPEKDHWSVITFRNNSDRFIPGNVSYNNEGGEVKINVSGKLGQLMVVYSITVSSDGLLEVSYSADGFSGKDRVEELGLRFELDNSFDSLEWNRKAYWNAYPANHAGADKGKARIEEYNRNSYRQRPLGQWELDNKSFYYNGLGGSAGLSYLAGSAKENIYSYSLKAEDGNKLMVVSPGEHACRLKKNGNSYSLYVNRYWDYLSLGWGNYIKNQILPGKVSDTIRLRVY